MYALFIVLNETDFLDEILARFVDVGVGGATILDSQGMASAIVHAQKQNVPLFGSIKTFLAGARPYNKTIFTVLESEALVEKTVAAVQDVMKAVSPTGAGFMFTVPIGKTYSMVPEK